MSSAASTVATAGRRHRRGEDQRAGVVLDVVDDVALARDESAERGEGLREGAHDEVGVLLDAEVLGRRAAVGAHVAHAVGVVEEDAEAVALLEADDLGEDARGRPPSRRRLR
jgi:hypothetical protein